MASYLGLCRTMNSSPRVQALGPSCASRPRSLRSSSRALGSTPPRPRHRRSCPPAVKPEPPLPTAGPARPPVAPPFALDIGAALVQPSAGLNGIPEQRVQPVLFLPVVAPRHPVAIVARQLDIGAVHQDWHVHPRLHAGPCDCRGQRRPTSRAHSCNPGRAWALRHVGNLPRLPGVAEIEEPNQASTPASRRGRSILGMHPRRPGGERL